MKALTFGFGGLLALLAVFSPAGPAQDQSIMAAVDTGLLRGRTANEVVMFKGVPFAAPPVGPLRWRAPAPPQPWRGERDATRFGPGCPQKDGPDNGGPERTSEDCLVLNIWAPAVRAPAGSSVMVWIHGGGWRSGHGSDPAFDGSAFARDGVVLVTVNYRLGALGVFAHPALTREAGARDPLGNYGLMDNIAALEWVKRNIAAFGGDPSRVTVAGESAGGEQVLNLLTTSRARGLFQQAIVESAPAATHDANLAQAEASGVRLAADLGLDADADMAALRAIPANRLVAAARDVAPFIDGRLVKETPLAAFAAGRAADAALLIGTNSDEGSLAPYYPAAVEEATALNGGMAGLRALYGPAVTDPTALQGRAFADTLFGAPARRIAAEAASGAPAFLYRFDYVPKVRREKTSGAAHGDEMIYVFDSLASAHDGIDTDEAMAHLVHACWAGFVETGRPQCPNSKPWPAYDAQSDTLMLFDPQGAQPVTRYHKAVFDVIEAKVLAGAVISNRPPG